MLRIEHYQAYESELRARHVALIETLRSYYRERIVKSIFRYRLRIPEILRDHLQRRTEDIRNPGSQMNLVVVDAAQFSSHFAVQLSHHLNVSVRLRSLFPWILQGPVSRAIYGRNRLRARFGDIGFLTKDQRLQAIFESKYQKQSC